MFPAGHCTVVEIPTNGVLWGIKADILFLIYIISTGKLSGSTPYHGMLLYLEPHRMSSSTRQLSFLLIIWPHDGVSICPGLGVLAFHLLYSESNTVYSTCLNGTAESPIHRHGPCWAGADAHRHTGRRQAGLFNSFSLKRRFRYVWSNSLAQTYGQRLNGL